MSASASDSALSDPALSDSRLAGPALSANPVDPRTEAKPESSELPGAGETLKAEALSHLAARRWRRALQVGSAAQRLRPDDIEVDGIIAMATAQRPWRRAANLATTALKERLDSGRSASGRLLTPREQASGWTALSSALLARNDHKGADEAARKAIDAAPESSAGWWQLTVSYAGLGWFDDAESCMTEARRRAGRTAGASGAASPLVSWQIGRAVNRWAMTRTPATWVTVIGWIVAGLLGVAAGITTPFLAREVRVGRLDGDLRSMADDAWAQEHRLRLTAAIVVSLLVAAWVFTISVAL